MPFFSIITVNLNNNAGLRKTLDSVRSQTFHDFEYLVIDGGSDDGSVQSIGEFQPGISYWVSEKDEGIYHAMNKGIQKASGTYLLFLNSGDCFADENVLQKVYSSEPEEELVSGNIIFLENGRERQDFTPPALRKFYLLHSMLYHPVTFICRDLFVEFGLYDQSLRIVSDYEFFLRILSARKISYRHLDLFVARFDNSGLSASAATRSLMLKEREKVKEKYFNPLLLFAFRAYLRIKKILRS